METTVGHIIKIEDYAYKIVGELQDHWIVIRNLGTWPQSPLILPKEPKQ